LTLIFLGAGDKKDWNDSGSEFDEKPNTSAPKTKKHQPFDQCFL
jgi:hypothetical protein